MKRPSPLLLLHPLVLCVVLGSPVCAETLGISHSGCTAPGTVVAQRVLLSQSVASPVFGMSFGVSIDPAFGDLLSVEPTQNLLDANGGAPLEFLAVEILPEGFTAQVTICSGCPGWSPPFHNTWLFEFEIAPDPAFGLGSTQLCFTESLGTPPVPIAVVNTLGSVTPTTACGTVNITEHEEWEFAVVDVDVPYDRATGSASFVATLTIGEYPCPPFPPTPYCPGFAFGLAHDPAVLAAIAAVPAPPIQAINGGNGPDYFDVEILPTGVTVACIASLMGTDSFQFPGATETLLVTYDTVPAPLAGALSPTTTTLAWSAGLGSPPVSVIILPSDGAEVPEGQIDGTVTLIPVDAPEFIRGDLDQNGALDIGDPIAILEYLFQSGADPWCAEVADVEGDGAIDVADPIYALQYLFGGLTPPPHPFPACGSMGLGACPGASAACP